MNNKKKVLVSGGSGLVGSAIKNICGINNQYFDPNDYEFVFASSSDVNFLDYNLALNYISNINPQIIIHLAANVGGLYKNISQPVEMLEHNLTINSNVLRSAHALGIKKLIACLSTCIFPDNTKYPIDESMLHLGPPHISNAAYAYAKRILEIQCKSYSLEYGYQYVCVIPTNIYGPNDNFNLTDSHVIPGLIHKCWLAHNSNSNFIISGSGKPLRQFIYSNDLANCILWVMTSYHSLDPIILAPDEQAEISIKTLVELISKECKFIGEIKFDTTKSDGQYKKTASNKLFRTYCPDFEFTKIEDGISQTVKWFVENYPNVRK